MSINFINDEDKLHLGKTLGTPFIGYTSAHSKKKTVIGLAFHGHKQLKESAAFLYFHMKINEGMTAYEAMIEVEKIFGKVI